MTEIQCPKCGKVTQIKDADPSRWDKRHQDAIARGERPKFLCFQCLQEEPESEPLPNS